VRLAAQSTANVRLAAHWVALSKISGLHIALAGAR